MKSKNQQKNHMKKKHLSFTSHLLAVLSLSPVSFFPNRSCGILSVVGFFEYSCVCVCSCVNGGVRQLHISFFSIICI